MFPGSGEEVRGHASDVWREGRRGRGTETRHRQLENNVQTTGKEFVGCINFIITSTLLCYHLDWRITEQEKIVSDFLFLVVCEDHVI